MPQVRDFSFGTVDLRAGKDTIKIAAVMISPSMTGFDIVNKEYGMKKISKVPEN